MIKEPYRDYVTEMIRLYNRVRTMTPQEREAWCETHNDRPELEDFMAVLRAASKKLTGEACLAMMAVYKPSVRKIHGAVVWYANENYTSTARVYRLLKTARRACAEERGLTVKS